MRPRKIRNLTTRRENCTDLRIPYELKSFDFRTNEEHENFFDLDEIFGRSAPIVMEIGCGKGQYVCEYAKRNPDKNILAIECVPSVLVEACEKVKNEGITNIRFLEMRAEYLSLFIKEKTISEIYLKDLGYHRNTKYPSQDKIDELLAMAEKYAEMSINNKNNETSPKWEEEAQTNLFKRKRAARRAALSFVY